MKNSEKAKISTSISDNAFIFFFYFLFKLYFIDYAIAVVPIFPFPPSTHHLNNLRQSPHHCSWPLVLHISCLAAPFPILYFISPWLFCNYLFVLLNPFTALPIPPHLSPIGQSSKYCLSVVLCSGLLSSFLDSIVHRFVLFAILFS